MNVFESPFAELALTSLRTGKPVVCGTDFGADDRNCGLYLTIAGEPELQLPVVMFRTNIGHALANDFALSVRDWWSAFAQELSDELVALSHLQPEDSIDWYGRRGQKP